MQNLPSDKLQFFKEIKQHIENELTCTSDADWKVIGYQSGIQVSSYKPQGRTMKFVKAKLIKMAVGVVICACLLVYFTDYLFWRLFPFGVMALMGYMAFRS